MVTRCEATQHAPVGRFVAVGRCVVVDHSAAVDHCAVVGRDAAADRFVALALQIVVFLGVVLVEIREALNVARSVVPNVVQRS